MASVLFHLPVELKVTLSWWFGLVVWGFEPLAVVEGK